MTSIQQALTLRLLTAFYALVCFLAVTVIAEETLPLPPGTELIEDQKYVSPSGGHYLIFQDDGNLVVYTSEGTFVWGLQMVTKNYQKIRRIGLQSDGNLAAYDANGGYLWSALTENPDATAELTLTSRGILQIVSAGRGVLWSSRP